jgi:hypothetical protein
LFTGSSFGDKAIRRAFIRKVSMISWLCCLHSYSHIFCRCTSSWWRSCLWRPSSLPSLFSSESLRFQFRNLQWLCSSFAVNRRNSGCGGTVGSTISHSMSITLFLAEHYDCNPVKLSNSPNGVYVTVILSCWQMLSQFFGPFSALHSWWLTLHWSAAVRCEGSPPATSSVSLSLWVVPWQHLLARQTHCRLIVYKQWDVIKCLLNDNIGLKSFAHFHVRA